MRKRASAFQHLLVERLKDCLPRKMCKNKPLTTVYKSFKLSPVNKVPFPSINQCLRCSPWKSQHGKHKIGMATHGAEETAVLCEATDVGRVLPFRSCTVILL